MAGALQGMLSALITLFLKRVVEFLNVRFGGFWRLALPPIVAVGVSATLLTTLHTLGGTPEILRTIALPLTVATIYATLYNFTLWKSEPGQPRNE